jgi:DNA-binding transcriptional ArsR family regulator
LKASKQGEQAAEIGKRNRNRIIIELLKSPLTFTTLKGKVELSGKTLAEHLKSLQNEGLAKREIQGKYIVYKVAKPETVLNLRKDFLKELAELITVYHNCLNNETRILLFKTVNVLQKSISHPEPEAETDKIFRKRIKIPKGFKGTITDNLDEPYGKLKLKRENTKDP